MIRSRAALIRNPVVPLEATVEHDGKTGTSGMGKRWLVVAAMMSVVGVVGCGNDASQSSSPSSSSSSDTSDASGSVTLTWDSPTVNADQSCMDDFGGYRISFGAVSRQYDGSRAPSDGEVTCVDSGSAPVPGCANSLICTYVLSGLPAGMWYIAVQAYDAAGNHGNYSNEIRRSIP